MLAVEWLEASQKNFTDLSAHYVHVIHVPYPVWRAEVASFDFEFDFSASPAEGAKIEAQAATVNTGSTAHSVKRQPSPHSSIHYYTATMLFFSFFKTLVDQQVSF